VEESVRITEDRDKWRKYVHGVANPRLLKNRTEQWERLTNKNFIETTRKLFTFDVSMKFLLVCLIQPNETFLSNGRDCSHWSLRVGELMYHVQFSSCAVNKLSV